MSEGKKGSWWLWVFAPINASVGVFFTLLPLHILELGGNVVDVGVVTSSYLLSLVPAALIWGYLVDHFPHRKIYIASSYLCMAALLVILQMCNRFDLFPFLLATFGFASAAATPALSLLIMESSFRSSWPDMIAKLSFTSIIGNDVGIIIGFIWVSFFALKGLILLSSILSLVSGLLVLRFVSEPKMTFERKAISLNRDIFTNRMRELPVLLGFPRPQEPRMFKRILRHVFLKEVPLLYFSVFFFNLGAQIYGTSYAPFLRQGHVLDNEIFIITFASATTQTATFYYIHRKRFFDRFSAVGTAKRVLVARLGVFVATGLVFALFQEDILMAASLGIFSVLGATWALYNTAVSSLVFRTLNPRRRGEILGFYTAFGGLFAFVGALSSGYLSSSLGYPVTCLVAAALMGASVYLLNLSAEAGERNRLKHDI